MTSPPSRANAALQTATLEHADCCIVGAGPAGAVLALLLARQGVRVALLERHEDFDRDFRGDALQPSALDVLGQMGLADGVLDLALAQHATFPLHTPSETVAFFDVSGLKTPFPFIAMVPQARFLQLVTEEASLCTTFRLAMGARVEALVEDQAGRVSGVRYHAHDGWHEVRSQLVVAPTAGSPVCAGWQGWSRSARHRRSICSGSACRAKRPTPPAAFIWGLAGGWRC
jgi:2-polyprenyl-6-methoxyphenol hydroxylase-like FAD-dependent oxidoreductase